MAHYIFIDLNGTLIGDSQKNLNFNQQHLSDFRKLVDELKSKKVIIGLCSDSPLEQLKVLSKRLGLDPTTPILAENGNLYFNGSEIISLKEFPSSLLEVAVTTAQKFADRKKITRANDIVAPEFGGEEIDTNTQWAIGANRTNSFSLFGSRDLIRMVSEELTIIFSNSVVEFGIDCSPEHNYLGLHPIADFRTGKRLALQWVLENDPLKPEGIWMIGDSMSDWMGTDNPSLHSCFVGDPKILNGEPNGVAKITDEVNVGSFKVSDLPALEGVNDILAGISGVVSLQAPVASL